MSANSSFRFRSSRLRGASHSSSSRWRSSTSRLRFASLSSASRLHYASRTSAKRLRSTASCLRCLSHSSSSRWISNCCCSAARSNACCSWSCCSLSHASSLLTKLLVLRWEVECECEHEHELIRDVDTFDALDLVVGSCRHELVSPPSLHPRCSNQAATRWSNSLLRIRYCSFKRFSRFFFSLSFRDNCSTATQSISTNKSLTLANNGRNSETSTLASSIRTSSQVKSSQVMFAL